MVEFGFAASLISFAAVIAWTGSSFLRTIKSTDAHTEDYPR